MTRARLAGFATRGLALLIDCALLDVAVLTLGAALAWVGTILGLEIEASTAVALGLAGTGWLILLSIYLTAFWWLAGQTPGMRFMGIRVTDLSGATPGFVRSLRRLVGFYVCWLTLGVGFLLVLVDDRRRGLHDRIARTLVVHTPRRRRSTQDDYTSSNPSVRARETASDRERTSSLR